MSILSGPHFPNPAAAWAEAAAGLRHGDAKEPAAIEMRVCGVDARRDPSPGLGEQRLVRCGVARGAGGTVVGAARHFLAKAVASGAGT